MSVAALMAPAGAGAEPPPRFSREEMARFGVKAFDAVVLRPVGLAGCVLGAGLFVPMAVATAPGGRDAVEEAMELMVLVPGRFVFDRPLGEF